MVPPHEIKGTLINGRCSRTSYPYSRPWMASKPRRAAVKRSFLSSRVKSRRAVARWAWALCSARSPTPRGSARARSFIRVRTSATASWRRGSRRRWAGAGVASSCSTGSPRKSRFLPRPKWPNLAYSARQYSAVSSLTYRLFGCFSSFALRPVRVQPMAESLRYAAKNIENTLLYSPKVPCATFRLKV